MKIILLVIVLAAFVSSCSIFKNNKTGCPSNGKNVGAEKILSGDKTSRKAKKFKS